MKRLAFAFSLCALAAPAIAQDSGWAYFEAEQETKGVKLLTAGSVSQDGSQLLLKCDKPGKGQVVAVIVTNNNIAAPSRTPPKRPIFIRYDGGPPKEYRWYFYPTSALAPNTKRDPLLMPFLEQLVDAGRIEVRMEPLDGHPMQTSFNVAGARDAINRVFERCQDENPFAKQE